MSDPSTENPLFTEVFDQIFALSACVQSSIYLLDGTDLKYIASRGLLPPEKVSKLNFPLDKSGGARLALIQEIPVLVADVKGEADLAQAFQDSAKAAPEATFDFIGSWIGFPIHIGGKPIALLDVCHGERGYFNQTHVDNLYKFIKTIESAIENAILFTNLSQQSTELQTLYTIQQAIYSHLDINLVLQLIADQALQLSSARQIIIWLRSFDQFQAVACAGVPDPVLQPGCQLSSQSTLVKYAIENKQTIRVLNTYRDDRIDPSETDTYHIHSMLAAPLLMEEGPNGVLMAVDNEVGSFGPNDERVLSLLAASAAIAIEKAQTYQKEQNRRFAAEGMQQILAQLSSDQRLDEILTGVLKLATGILHLDAGALYLITPGSPKPHLVATHQIPEEYLSDLDTLTSCYSQNLASRQAVFPVDSCESDKEGWHKFVQTITPTIYIRSFSELASDPDFLQENPVKRAAFLRFVTTYESVLHVAFSTKDDIVGFMNLFSTSNHQMTPDEHQIAETIGSHVALRIDRDRLASKAEELVRLQEQQRIAQNLHDTVTQILFRAGLEASWCIQNSKSDSEYRNRLKTIQHLITRSTYEMRSAIFALSNYPIGQDHSLVDLLQAQVNSFQNETGVQASLIVVNELGVLPVPVTEAIYRLVREALSNIYKHARASAALVSIKRVENQVITTIQDNGSGITSDAYLDPLETALHFGVHSMKQMVVQLGGEFSIENNEDQGVNVKAIIPIQMEKVS